MALERKDVRLKLDHDVHVAVKAIAEGYGMEPAEWVETVINDVVKKRVHEASVFIDKLNASGSLGKLREIAGTP